MSYLSLLHITKLSHIDFDEIDTIASEISQVQIPEIIILSGLSPASHQGFLKASIVFQKLRQKLNVDHTLVIPSKTDIVQLRAFNDSFYRPFFQKPFSFSTCPLISLPDLLLVGLNAFRGPKPIGISESQFLEMSGRAQEICQGSPVSRILVTNVPTGKWEDWPKLGLTQWAAEAPLLELTTGYARPQIDSITSSVTEDGRIQLFQLKSEELVSRMQLQKVGQWVPLVNGNIDLSHWLSHFRKMDLSKAHHTVSISLFLARAVGAGGNAERFKAIHEAVLILKNRIAKSAPNIITTGQDGKPAKGDALVLHDGRYVPAYYGWRYVAELEATSQPSVANF